MRLEQEIFVENIDFAVGDRITISGGPFDGRDANIVQILEEKHMVKAAMTMFGKETTIELSYSQIRKLS